MIPPFGYISVRDKLEIPLLVELRVLCKKNIKASKHVDSNNP
jgi:hypothetical protein